MKKIWLLVIGFFLLIILAACSRTTEGLKVGDKAPDFSLPSADGKTVSLSDYVGKQPVLLYFHMALG